MKQSRLSDARPAGWNGGSLPIHRTLSFYLSLFPIVLLLWAWTDSRSHWTLWQLRRGVDHAVWIELEESALHLGETLTQTPGESYLGGSYSNLPANALTGWTREPLQRSVESWFPEPRVVRRSEGGHLFPAINLTHYVLPLWVILLGYLPLWLALVAWRAWRISILCRRRATWPRSEDAGTIC